ncbi:MAG: S-adenosylmethionine decarboxylase [Bacteriovoracaceae bacterium]|nr:S-adenosylmethionine decarboxylase [Bacteriovoracaceae bacterium]
MDIRSQHMLVDLWFENELKESDVEHICSVIEDNLTVIKKSNHKFEPMGETIVFILGESHFSLHTYPEHNYITLDVYICSMDVDLHSILEKITDGVNVLHMERKFLTRGEWEEFDEKNVDISASQKKSLSLMAVTFVVAACSIIYELLMAQTLSSTMGDTTYRYNMTIGLYIAAMGVGALFYSKIIKGEKLLRLAQLEGVISVVGGLAPIMVLFGDFFAHWISKKTGMNYFGFFVQGYLSLFCHGIIVLIGFLTGLELPLLMDLGKELKAKLSSVVLSVDYLGTLAGVVAFPLIIFPNFQLFTIGFLVAFLNSSVALVLYFSNGMKNIKLLILLSMVSVIYFIALLNGDKITEIILNKMYFFNL